MTSSSTPPSYVSGSQVSGGFTYTSGQSVDVVSGGHIYDMTIDANAYEYVDVGGHASATTINKNGSAFVDLGGVTTATTVNKGGVEELDGGMASGSILNSGGVQSVTSGSAIYTTVHSGGAEDVSSSGTDTSTTLSKGGGEHVYSGGIAYDTKILAGGTEFVTEGGSASGVDVQSGGRIILGADVLYSDDFKASSGSAKAVGVYKNGVETITYKHLPAKTLYNKIVASGGTKDYYSGNKLVLQTVRVGNELDYTYYTKSGVQTGSSFSQAYPEAGAASNVTVENGGSAVLAGGSVTGLTVLSGGTEIVGEDFSVLSAGGKFQFKISGVVVTGGSVGNGGKEIVNAKDATVGAVVASGGTETIESGGIASNSVISGGTLDVVNGGSEAGAVYFEGTGGEFVIGATTMPATVISGFAFGDKIEMAGVTYSAGATAVVKSAGVVTISNGGVTYKLNIAGAAAGEKFTFSKGSILTETAATAVSSAQMSFLTPLESASADALAAPIAIVPAGPVHAPGWVSKTVTQGPLYAALTSAPHSALVAALGGRGGTESF
jgi:autotransporter passenger strand-loop-strand repeat protein